MEILIDGKNLFNCSKQELRNVSSELKRAWSLADQRAVLEFIPGQAVTFLHKGQIINAKVTATNKTTVNISSDIGNYNISPTLLTKANG